MSAFITVLLLIAVVITLFVVGIHWGFRAPRQIENGTPQDLGFAFEQVWIPSVANKRLFGWFLPAGNATQTLAIFHHKRCPTFRPMRLVCAPVHV